MPFADVAGAKLHYRMAGSGADAVLLLHAFPLHSGMWARQLEELGKRWRVVAPDYRGLGQSGGAAGASTMELLAGDVLALLDGLGVQRAAVAGLSMGGYLAFELYRRRPSLFRALALCDTKAGADSDEARATREKFAASALEKGLGWVADEMTPKLLRPGPDPAVVQEVRALVAGCTPEGVAAAQRGMARRPDSTALLPGIACPTLVVVGDDDGLTPPAEAEKMARAIPGARLERLPRAGHLSNLESPEAFTRALSGLFGAA
jgi:pimeloyl-ACP methyl ester carboxylesterase